MDDLAFNGFDSSQPGLGAPYPRMLYKAGKAETLHGFDVDTMIVHSEEQEEQRAAEGWATTPTRAHKPAPPPKPDDRDARIAELEAQLAARTASDVPRRGPNRPPNSPKPNIA